MLSICFVPLVGVAPTFLILTVFVCLGSIGQSLFHPPVAGMISTYAGRHFSFCMSIFNMGGTLAFGVGPLLITALVEAYGPPGTLVFDIDRHPACRGAVQAGAPTGGRGSLQPWVFRIHPGSSGWVVEGDCHAVGGDGPAGVHQPGVRHLLPDPLRARRVLAGLDRPGFGALHRGGRCQRAGRRQRRRPDALPAGLRCDPLPDRAGPDAFSLAEGGMGLSLRLPVGVLLHGHAAARGRRSARSWPRAGARWFPVS